MILTEKPADGVGLVRLNRPQALNALNTQITREIFDALEIFDHDETIGCMVLTGSDKAFAAGADIKQMVGATAVQMMTDDFTDWSRLARMGKPVIGAVSVLYAVAASTRALPPGLRGHPIAFLPMTVLRPVAYLLLTPLGMFTLDTSSWETRGHVAGAPAGGKAPGP